MHTTRGGEDQTTAHTDGGVEGGVEIGADQHSDTSRLGERLQAPSGNDAVAHRDHRNQADLRVHHCQVRSVRPESGRSEPDGRPVSADQTAARSAATLRRLLRNQRTTSIRSVIESAATKARMNASV